MFIFVVRPLEMFPSLRMLPVYSQSRFLGRMGRARVLSRTVNALLINRKEKELNCYRFYQILSPH